MAQMLKKMLGLVLLACAGAVDVVATTPIIKPRSQSFNQARWDAGLNHSLYKHGMDETNGSWQFTVGGGQSFRTGYLMPVLFGTDVTASKTTATLKIQGSGNMASPKSATSWLADYFGLPRDYDGDVNFKPKISNAFIDFSRYFGLDGLVEGLYFKAHAPLVWAKWNLGATETFRNAGTVGFPAFYMHPGSDVIIFTPGTTSASGLLASTLRHSFLSAMDGTNTFGDMKDPLNYGKFTSCALTKVRFSDVEAALGYNIVLNEDYHLGLQLMASAPAGGKPTAEYLFEPMVGNGGHFTLGGGLTAHATVWQSDCGDSSLGFYLDANVVHMFKSYQLRPFDFKNKPNSRYMLLAEHAAQSSRTDLTESTFTSSPVVAPTSTQYTGRLFHAINKTTLCADVSFGAQGELALKAVYKNGGLSVDLGYDLWGRSAEKICLKGSIPTQKYTIKGDASLYGFGNLNINLEGECVAGAFYKLNISQNAADIHNGQVVAGARNFLRSPTTDSFRNLNVDNIHGAGNFEGLGLDSLPPATDAETVSSGADAISTGRTLNLSQPALFISTNDLDTTGAAAVLTHKVFTHVGYAFTENECWNPFVGLGMEAEFAQGSCSGSKGALSQWNVWAKGGVSF